MEEQKILEELKQFTGTENYYRSDFGKLKLTDGIQFLREKLKCYWLIGIVESVWDLEKIQKNKEFIVWKIEVDNDRNWKVSAWNDTPYKSNLLYEQKGGYTDFDLKSFEFYQINDVILLTSEY